MKQHEVGQGEQVMGDRRDCFGNDHGRAQRLRALATNLLEVAREIEDDPAQPATAPQNKSEARLRGPAISLRALLERTAQDYNDRRARRRYFPAELFGEPAWDLLLDLFQARLAGRNISVTSACIGADVPLTTALRWISVLEGEGLVERSRNPYDSRSTWVSLTDSAAVAMSDYIEGCLVRGRRVERLSEESLLLIRANEAA